MTFYVLFFFRLMLPFVSWKCTPTEFRGIQTFLFYIQSRPFLCSKMRRNAHENVKCEHFALIARALVNPIPPSQSITYRVERMSSSSKNSSENQFKNGQREFQ